MAGQVLGTKLRSQNKVYKVDKSTDLEMCKAIVRSAPRPLDARRDARAVRERCHMDPL